MSCDLGDNHQNQEYHIHKYISLEKLAEDRGAWVVPDGGLKAWSVVAASFMILNFDGIVFSFGILLPTIAQQFNTGREEAALTHAIMNFSSFAFAPAANHNCGL